MSSRPTTNETLFGEVRQSIGPYRVLGIIGHGGMATVYKAMQPELDRTVAIKVLLPVFANDAGFRARFEREARLIARLRHPHIVGIYGADEDAGMPFLVMEYLDGVNLQQELRRRHASSDPYSPVEVQALLQPLAHALDYAHGLGIIHRDLKPENIILTANGPVITDFGLAKLLMEEAATVSVVMGTPSYMAPEQIQAEPVDARTDVYALGIILYELLTGRVPYTGSTPFAIAQAHINEPIPSLADLDPRWSQATMLNDVARRAIAKRKVDRWPSAGALLAALMRALDTPIEPATPASMGTRPTPVNKTRLAPPPLAAPSRLQRPPKLDGVGRYVLIVPLILLVVLGIWAVSMWSQSVVSTRPSPRPPAELTTVVPSGVAAARTPTRTSQSATVIPNTQGVVRAQNGAFLRSGPGTNFEIIGGLPNGTTLVLESVNDDWLGVATSDGRRGWIASQLLEVTSGDVSTLPVRTVPSPIATAIPSAAPTVALPTSAAVPVAGTLRLEDTDFSGGWRNRGASIYGGRTATWVYGQGSGYDTMRASFQASTSPGATAVLRITGMDSEDRAKTPMRVTINGTCCSKEITPCRTTIFRSTSGRWDELVLRFDAVYYAMEPIRLQSQTSRRGGRRFAICGGGLRRRRAAVSDVTHLPRVRLSMRRLLAHRLEA